MNPGPCSTARTPSGPRQRGSVYVLVLGVATILMIVGVSVSGIARSQIRAASARSLVSAASTDAMGGLELAAEIFSLHPDWRRGFGNSASIENISIGRARTTLTFVDEIDGLLWNDDTQPVRVFATATIGGVQRICSQVFEPSERVPPPGLDAAILADKAITVDAKVSLTAVNGRVQSNTSISTILLSQTNADIAAPVVLALGGVSGSITTGTAQMPLPGADAWNTLAALATTIPYANIGGDKLDECVLSPASNPFGPVNAAGIYRIDVPANKNFEIERLRIDATLLINLGTGAELRLKEKISWDGRARGVALIVNANAASSKVNLENTVDPVSESDIKQNFNPFGSPYLGQIDADQTDFYPVGIRGLVHVLGRAPVTIDTNFVLNGCLLVESTLLVKENTTIYSDPSLMINPPLGYEGFMLMRPRPGSFRWELEETRDAVIETTKALAGTTTPPSGRSSSLPTTVLSVIEAVLGVK